MSREAMTRGSADPALQAADEFPELTELADTVTEMALVKHHFKAGVPAQRGIED